MKPRATAFAPAKSGGGNLSWEAAGTTCWSTITNVFGLATSTYNISCDGQQTAYNTFGLVLIPINETRGTVSLLRVRGYLGTHLAGSPGNGAELREHTVHYILQLVPKLRHATAPSLPDQEQLLSGNLADDQESIRIIHQWVAFPAGEHGLTVTSDGAGQPAETYWWREVDVKSKRRFNRAEYALVLSATIRSNVADLINAYANLRMLFRADDGL